MRDLRRFVGQLLCVGYEGSEPSAALMRMAAAGELGSFIIFARNLVPSFPQNVARIAALGEHARVAIDQEGGRVARFKEPVVSLPPARVLGENDDIDLTALAGRTLGAQLAAIGIDIDFAPVLDVDANPSTSVIGDRSFGADPDRVVRHGLAFANGLRDGGVLPCAKHFPGHGGTTTDSHLTLPRVSRDREHLAQIDIAPFAQSALAFPMIMTAHVCYDALDPKAPATLSEAIVTKLLKGELGFRGVVLSDDLEMKALGQPETPIDEVAVLALEAGCDLLLVCEKESNVMAVFETVLKRAEASAIFRDRVRDANHRLSTLPSTSPRCDLSDRLDAFERVPTDALVASLSKLS